MDRNWVAVIFVAVVSLALIANSLFSTFNYGALLLSPGDGGDVSYVIFLGALTLVVVLIIGLVFNRKSAKSKRIRR